MAIVWQQIFVPIVCCCLLVSSSSSSIDAFFLDRLQINISDYSSLNTFYQNFLQKIRHHRLIDTVYSPINLSYIESGNYNENYLNNSVRFVLLIFDQFQYPVGLFSATNQLLIYFGLMATMTLKWNLLSTI
jgi:hypothetical protein